jgi:hypothetical protein
MKRIYLMFVVLLLSACDVSIGPSTSVNVTPSPVTLGTGDSQVLTASLSSGTAEDFTWTLRSGEGTLSLTQGTTVTYTAPGTVGDYDITVSAIGVEAKNAVVTASVLKKFLATLEDTTVVNSNPADQTINAGETKRFIVGIPGELNEALLYFELGAVDVNNPNNDGLTLTVKDEAQNVVAVSNDPRFFSRTASSLQNTLEPQIVIPVTCRGACVILKNDDSSRYFLEVKASSNASFALFAFDDKHSDDLEPNDSTCTPATTVPNATFEGAIETLGDIDCFQTTVNVPSITLSPTLQMAIPIKAEIRAASNDEKLGEVVVTPGGQNVVFTVPSPARPVKVLVTSADQAGPTQNSTYGLNIVLNP